MLSMSKTTEWKEMASQLRQPNGARGIEVANMMNETNIRMTYHAIHRLQLREGDRILELGHGNGAHLGYLLEQREGLTYVGLDISDLMNAEAQRINRTFVVSNRASFHLYDGSHIPFPENYFDRIFTVNTIYFWSDPRLLLSELYRVLRPNGILNITLAPKDFMKQLPFTPFGFTLYDDDALLKLIGHTSFRLAGVEKQTEIVKTKAGDPVERPFATFTIGK